MIEIATLDKLQTRIVRRLEKELHPKFTYHSFYHTLDVIEASERIGMAEGLSDDEVNLVKLAAAYHDAGFIISDDNHEERSCEMLREEAADSLEPEVIETLCSMIIATKVPQRPSNLMEKVLCDADLDYLGREDFPEISNSLFEEFKVRGVVQGEQDWINLQISFFETHKYWTAYSQEFREPGKQSTLQSLRLDAAV